MQLPALDSARRKRLLLGSLLIVATLVLYLQVLNHAFIHGWDDNIYITDNPHVTSGLKITNVAWALTALEPFYWHPVTWLSHMLDCQLFGVNSGAHHYENAVFHALNVALLFWILCAGTQAIWRSFVAAALFAVHPLNVETVAWAAERKSLLSLFFSLLAVAAYGWYVRQPGWRRYSLVALALLVALMCKPTAITLPLVLLFLDYWPLDRYPELSLSRRWGRLLIEKLPLAPVGLGVTALAFVGERAGGTVVPFSVLPLSTRLENAVISYVKYVGHILWPVNLSVFYPHPATIVGPSLPIDQVIASILILVGITALVFHFRQARYLAFGWLLFLVTLAPMIGIIQFGYQGMQDHFTYVPCLGFFIALTWGMGDIVESLSIKRALVAVTCSVLIAGCAAATHYYLHFWKDGVELFAHARSVTAQPNPWLEQLYGNALLSAGRADEALQHFQVSCALGPRNEYCHYGIAGILFHRGQLEDALQEYQVALGLTQNQSVALDCLDQSGEALFRMGAYDAARQAIAEALKIDPQNEPALRLQGKLFAHGDGN